MIHAIQWEGKTLISGAREQALKVWDLSCPDKIELRKILEYPRNDDQTSEVNALQLQGFHLVSGYSNGDIVLY